jgi:hypothetical protein
MPKDDTTQVKGAQKGFKPNSNQYKWHKHDVATKDRHNITKELVRRLGW